MAIRRKLKRSGPEETHGLHFPGVQQHCDISRGSRCSGLVPPWLPATLVATLPRPCIPKLLRNVEPGHVCGQASGLPEEWGGVGGEGGIGHPCQRRDGVLHPF
jgi:hypothetical protein